MAASVLPEVLDALVARARDALPTVVVVDAILTPNDVGDYLMVGVSDPAAEAQTAGVSQQSWPHAGAHARDEQGEVVCIAESWTGDTEPGDDATASAAKVARDKVYALVDDVAQLCRDDITLGIAEVLFTNFGTSTQLTQGQNSNGAWARVTFRIAFQARNYT